MQQNRHAPIIRDRADAKGLVVCIHGIMGSPRQYLPYIDAVYDAGYSVAALLLPGHGEGAVSFARSHLSAWEKHVNEALSEYAKRFDRIVILGHSMGGLLGLNESLKPNSPIVGAFLIAPPMKINLRLRSVIMRIKLVSAKNMRTMFESYMDLSSVEMGSIAQFALWARPFISLKLLIEKAKRRLNDVTIPVVFIHSQSDETVSPKSAALLEKGLKNAPHERVTLSESTHVYFPSDEVEWIKMKLLAFLEAVMQLPDERS